MSAEVSVPRAALSLAEFSHVCHLGVGEKAVLVVVAVIAAKMEERAHHQKPKCRNGRQGQHGPVVSAIYSIQEL